MVVLLGGMALAQNEQQPETDPVILNRIGQWQDLKFGFMMHWGIYAQWGVVKSWSICNEPWIDCKGAPYVEYKQQYQALNRTFNPTQFRPDQMAAAAKRAGMKYVVFTTKHHDGFCMFHSRETDYSVAGRGVAIYGTRPLYPYSQGNVRYTQSKDGKHRYAICLLEEGQHHSLTIELPFVVKKVRPLAPNAKRKITCKTGKNSTVVSITAAGILQHAVVLEF